MRVIKQNNQLTTIKKTGIKKEIAIDQVFYISANVIWYKIL